LKKLLAPLAVAAVGVAALAPAATAAEPTTVTVRQADLIGALSGTRATGHVDFLKDGLHVWTEGSTNTGPRTDGGAGTWNTDKAAEYFPVSGPLPTSGSLEWFGTTPAPGAQIVFDVDGITNNGNDYNVLVGEAVYGDTWWLSNSSSAAAKAADPSGANDGGSGSAYFGTLPEWKAALPAEARILAGGFSLGSGVKGDGVLRTATFGGTEYEFTSQAAVVAPEPPAVVDVTAKATVTKSARKVRVAMVSNELPANTVQGQKVRWRIAVDGRRVARFIQGAGETDVFVARFAKDSGKHVVTVKLGGQVVRTVTVRA
jgi:hypothetical protein